MCDFSSDDVRIVPGQKAATNGLDTNLVQRFSVNNVQQKVFSVLIILYKLHRETLLPSAVILSVGPSVRLSVTIVLSVYVLPAGRAIMFVFSCQPPDMAVSRVKFCADAVNR